MAFQTDGVVVKNERVKSVYFLLTVHCPPIANEIKSGQFVMLKVSEDHSPLLRRPFSVYKSYPVSHPDKGRRGCLLLLYKKVGKGTEKMTKLRKGQTLDLIGPLGNGFSMPPLPSSKNIVLLGGGVGIVSLYSLAEMSRPERLFIFIGGKTEDDILCEEDFRKLGASKIFIATEDGSLGYKGTVIDLFLSQGSRSKGSNSYHLYACGPIEMLRELARTVKSKEVVCQVSLETRMACGFGACWGCVIKTTDPQAPYQRVCKEGPVFNLKEIVWESS